MSAQAGKPDVVELARAQLDFSALNTGAPAAKDILFKAQTIVPMQPRLPWERYAAAGGALLLLAAMLLLPWLPQRQLLSVAGVQFDELLSPQQAQELIDRAVQGLASTDASAMLSADFAPQAQGGGLLMLKATSFSEPCAELQQRLAQTLGQDAPAFATYRINGQELHSFHSPLAMVLSSLRDTTHGVAAGHPAAALADSVVRTEGLLRQQLAADLLQHGFILSGFAFSGDDALLPAGCHFVVDAWPRSIAVGVRGFHQLASYQQAELRSLVVTWLERLNLAGNRLQLAEVQASRPLQAEVSDQLGRRDELLTARLNAALRQPTVEEQANPDFSFEERVADAAALVLPGFERRVELERLSRVGELPRYRARVQLLGQAENTASAATLKDPVESSAVKEEW